MIKFKFKGAKVFENKVNRSINDLGDKFQQMILAEVDKIDNTAKLKVPVDTGELKRSHYRSQNINTDSLRVEIGFSTYYAPYQDFGTGKRFSTSRYKNYLAYIANFRGKQPANPSVVGKMYLFYPYMLGTRKMDRKTKTFVKNLL